MKRDIENRKDIQTLISAFYTTLMQNKEFEHLFLEVIQIDVLEHIDIMVDFWESALFQAGKYKRDLVDVHLDVNRKFNYGLKERHFNMWLDCFNSTVDGMFEGPKAKGIKERAFTIATIIKMKIDHLEQKRMEINN